MTNAQELARALNVQTKSGAFSHTKARATARQAGTVDWPKTKERNDDFNPEVDGCETFVMSDGSVCEWMPASQNYVARAK